MLNTMVRFFWNKWCSCMLRKKKEEKKKEREQTVLLFLPYCPFCRNYVQIAMGTHLGVFCIKKHESTRQIPASISSLTLTEASKKLNYLLKIIYFTISTFEGILIRKKSYKILWLSWKWECNSLLEFLLSEKTILEFDEKLRLRPINRNISK